METIELVNGQTLELVTGGYRLRATEDYVVDCTRMLFNWRLHVTTPELDGREYLHGYCYFGRDVTTMHRAIAAGLAWEDPLHTAPEGYDKQAY